MSLFDLFFGTKIEHPLLARIYKELLETQNKINQAQKEFDAALVWSRKTHGGATDADVGRKATKCKQAIKYLQGKLTKIVAEMETGKWDTQYYGIDEDKEMLDRLQEEIKRQKKSKEE